MNRPVKRSQSRIVFVMVRVVIIFVAVWMTWKPRTSTLEGRAESAKDVRWWYPLPRFVEPTPFRLPVRPSPAAALEEHFSTSFQSDMAAIPSPIPGPVHDEFNSLAVRTFSPAPIDFKTLAVVDVDRLLTAYLPGSDSKEARATVLADIQRAVAICASAHDFVLVFDRTGKSLNGVPTVLGSADRFDLTDEVAQQLAYLRPTDSGR